MTSLTASATKPLRWAAMLPVALLAALVFQLISMFLISRSLGFFFGLEPAWIMAAVKGGSSLFMSAAFVAGAAWCAPAHRQAVALGAFALVVFWGGLSLSDASMLGIVIGILGMVGAGFSVWLVRDRLA